VHICHGCVRDAGQLPAGKQSTDSFVATDRQSSSAKLATTVAGVAAFGSQRCQRPPAV